MHYIGLVRDEVFHSKNQMPIHGFENFKKPRKHLQILKKSNQKNLQTKQDILNIPTQKIYSSKPNNIPLIIFLEVY